MGNVETTLRCQQSSFATPPLLPYFVSHTSWNSNIHEEVSWIHQLRHPRTHGRNIPTVGGSAVHVRM